MYEAYEIISSTYQAYRFQAYRVPDPVPVTPISFGLRVTPLEDFEKEDQC